jgi:hypothetical protein
MSPLLAQSGHPDALNQCPLSGVKRTLTDPLQTTRVGLVLPFPKPQGSDERRGAPFGNNDTLDI